MDVSFIKIFSNAICTYSPSTYIFQFLLSDESENEETPIIEIDSSTSTFFIAVMTATMIFITGFIP